MLSQIEPVLYIDLQALPPVALCPTCGWELYRPGALCPRCRRELP